MSDEPDEKPKNAFCLASADSFVSRHLMPLKAVRVAVLDESGEPIEALDVFGEARRSCGRKRLSHARRKWPLPLHVLARGHWDRFASTGAARCEIISPSNAAPTLDAGVRESIRWRQRNRGQTTVDVDLYDTSTEPPSPLWEQDDLSEKNEALSLANLVQPYWHDVVRIRLPDEVRPSKLQVLTRSDLGSGVVFPGDSLLLVGYPYGYSVMKKQPTPIVLKRSVAAGWGLEGFRRREILLDGGGAPGMSGGPVFRVQADKLYLFGIYTGILFPDAPCTEPKHATALGSVCDLSLIPHLPFACAAIPQ